MSPEMNNYILFWVSIMGLCMGSFFNVVILRSLSGESIVFPPSKCPKCNHKLYPWHNIPVLSYIFLRGKCHFCKEKISIQYPIVELLTMIMYAAAFLTYGASLDTLFAIVIISSLIIMTATDIKEQSVDCNLAIGLAITALIFHLFAKGLNIPSFTDSLLGLIIGAGVIELFAHAGKLFFKKRAMGEADTYVAGALGACFGLQNLIPFFIYSFAASLLFVIPAFIYNQYKKNNKAVCILFILFILTSLILFKYSFEVMWQHYLLLGILAIIGISLAAMILRGLKNESTPLYMPFVPALALGALYFIFF